MDCVNCKYPESSVVETRKNDNKGITVRRRECLKCGTRYTTHERLRDEPYKTVPPMSILPR